MAGLGTRIRNWFNGGDPDGRAKIRTWVPIDFLPSVLPCSLIPGHPP